MLCDNAGVADPSLTAAERQALALAHAQAGRAALLLALTLVVALVAVAVTLQRLLDPGACLAILLLCGWWAWLLRRAPRRWRASGRDLAGGRADTVEGSAAIRLHRGIGLLAPSSHRLLLGRHQFHISAAQARALREGMQLQARIAPASEALLSVAVLEPAGRPSSAVPEPVCEDGALVQVLPTVPSGTDAPALTPREQALLQLIAAGHADKEIARRLGLEPATVRTYNSQLYARLGARRRTEAVARARALGLLTDIQD